MPHPTLITQLVAASVLGLSANSWAAPAAQRAPLPTLLLSEAGASGQQAIELLGAQLPAVAAHYHKTSEELRALLLRDPLVRLDLNGRLYVVDTLERRLPPAPEHGPTRHAAGLNPAPLDKTFTLHSKADAKRTIYLDFNGAVLQNTAWNSGGNTITALPFDIDGNPANFSDAELERMQYIWQRVAEDYAPFDIDVTTEEPPADRLTRSSNADDVYGTTVLVTHNAGVYDCSCGGVAYVGVYDNVGDFYKPALVFWNMLGTGNEKYVAEAASHEAGHNLGLSHDGWSGGGYYPGHGEGATGWAPIMGVGYYKDVVQWSKGEYPTANNVEDDFVVVGLNGGPLRPDDHGDTAASASPLTTSRSGALTKLKGTGVISTASDQDVFSFQAGAGNAVIRIKTDKRSANLDVKMVLRDANGTVIAKSQPAGKLNAGTQLTLPSAGTYYVAVEGVGFGDLVTGYSDYGSLGQYSITGNVPTP